jgi:hypothetical protein
MCLLFSLLLLLLLTVYGQEALGIRELLYMSTPAVRLGDVWKEELHAYKTLMCKLHEEHECVVSSKGISATNQSWLGATEPTNHDVGLRDRDQCVLHSWGPSSWVGCVAPKQQSIGWSWVRLSNFSTSPFVVGPHSYHLV